MDEVVLRRLNGLGIIPGPGETEVEFKARAEYCLNLKQNIREYVDLKGEFAEGAYLQEVAEVTQRLFDIRPEWCPLLFSNEKLLPWHGGCAWIFQNEETLTTGAFLQLRKAFAGSRRYLGIYERQELLAHESAHVGRMLFEEPKFEEIIAYKTAKTGFRRYFGPLIQAPWEALLFFVFLFMALFYLIFFDSLLLTMLPAAWFLMGITRLVGRQNAFTRCLGKLSHLLKNAHAAHAVIYRLRDEEILRFSKMSSEEILRYVHAHQNELRWRAIYTIYFTTKS